MFAARGAGRYASGSPACAFFKKSVHSICSELLDRTVAAGPCAAVLTVARQHRSRAGHKVPLLLPARRRLTESAGTVRYAVECAVRWHSDKGTSPAAPGPKVATGEDAFCVTELKSHYLFGVADGVGGWVSQGVDPSLFSWALMKACSDVAPNTPVVPGLPFSQAVLASAWNKVNKDRKVLAGSSTAVVVTLNKHSGLIEVANLGDSYAAVIRRGKFVLETTEQQHYFNAPYQLGITRAGGDDLQDNADMADTYNVQAEDGDLILLCTDGYSDNVFGETSLIITDKLRSPRNAKTKFTIGSLADLMIMTARERAHSTTVETPFSENAARHGYHYEGGKIDDITLIVAQVRASSSSDGGPAFTLRML